MRFKKLDFRRMLGTKFEYVSRPDWFDGEWDHEGLVLVPGLKREIELFPAYVNITKDQVLALSPMKNIRIIEAKTHNVRVLPLRIEELSPAGEVTYTVFIPSTFYLGFGVKNGRMYKYFWAKDLEGEVGKSTQGCLKVLLTALGFTPIEQVIRLGLFLVIPLPDSFREDRMLVYLGI